MISDTDIITLRRGKSLNGLRTFMLKKEHLGETIQMSSNIQKTMIRRNTPFSVWRKGKSACLYIDVKKTGFNSRKINK